MMRLACFSVLVLCLAVFAGILPSEVAEAKTRTIYGINSDGTLWLSDTTYSTAREMATGDIDDADAYFTVGQATGYSVWRGCLFFNTEEIPDTATITSVTLYLYARNVQSSSGFTVRLISEPLVGAPMEGTDYGLLYNETTELGTLSVTSSLPTDEYSSISLNSTGWASINRSGYTIFGLRSVDDINGTTPTANEYAEFWAQERGYEYEPMLAVTYSETAIADLLVTSIDMDIGNIEVYTDYIEAGDQLYVFTADVSYRLFDSTFEPSEDPVACYEIRLYESAGGDLEAVVRLPAWGPTPAHVYFNADTALPWGEEYVLGIVGAEAVFGTGLDRPESQGFQLERSDWKGGDMTRLDAWVRGQAIALGVEIEGDRGAYVDKVAGEVKVNEAGAALFLTGIPSLEEVRPDLFYTAEETFDWGDMDEHDPTFEDGMSSNFGTTMLGYLDDIGDVAGIDGRFVGGAIWCILMIVVVAFISIQMNNPTAGIIVAIPFLLVGNFTHMIPLALTAVIGAVCLLFLFRQVWLKV